MIGCRFCDDVFLTSSERAWHEYYEHGYEYEEVPPRG
jgi:hypothetical protein